MWPPAARAFITALIKEERTALLKNSQEAELPQILLSYLEEVLETNRSE